jgi:shikimate dehydrogenase
VSEDRRLRINKDTKLCMSLASRPGNFGTRLHNFLYAAMDLNYLYKAFTTTDLKSAIAGIRALAIRGCAISMPFKEEVMQYLDQIDPSAARIRAVNTIVNDDGVLSGFNTDYIAIHKIVNERAVPLSARICVFGSGGMAKAIVSALDKARYRAVSIVARNAKTGGPLAEKYGYRWFPEIPQEERFEVLINASPVGMFPDMQSCPFSEKQVRDAEIVIDSVANPVQTQLIRTAATLKKAYVTGFDITIIQSIEQFHMYTGVLPDDATLEAAREFVQASI